MSRHWKPSTLPIHVSYLYFSEEQSFFKPHKDTPRGESFFGTLVIVFPTQHQGGALVLRQEDEEWTFDSAQLLSECSQPSIAYIAFYGDVEHEVLPVTSGYRITVTYNLYFEDSSDSPDHSFGVPRPLVNYDMKSEFQTQLEELLRETTFLPGGGRVGFGLRHEYPVMRDSGGSLQEHLEDLKGSDAAIYQACEALHLNASLRAIHEMTGNYPIICKSTIDSYDVKLANSYESDELESYLLEECRGVWLESTMSGGLKVHWATQPATNRFGQDYVACGNEAYLDTVYYRLCLVIKIPSAEKRTAISNGDTGLSGYESAGSSDR